MAGTDGNAELGNTASGTPSATAATAPVAPTRTRKRQAKSSQGPPPASLYPKTFEFISTDPLSKQQPDTRAFIRSYVMRGKNTKKKNKVDAETDATRTAGESSQVVAHRRGPPVTLGTDASPTSSEIVRSKNPNDKDSKVTHQGYALAHDKYGTTTVVVMSVFFPAPIKAPHDLSLWNFSDLLDYKAMLKLNNFFRVLKESMFPVEYCFMPDSTKTCWFRWLCESEAYLYSVLLTVSIIQDVFRVTKTTAVNYTSGRLPSDLLSARSRSYMRSTIVHLQERLKNPETANDDITIAIILTLTNIADVAGDYDVCKAHVDGLRKMVLSRGGLKGFDNTQLVSKISRIDLGWALKYGVKPDFADPEMSWEPHLDNTILLESPVPPELMSNSVRDYVQSVDHKLRNIFADLQAFASVANKLATSSRKLRPDLFQEIMLSIQYRLMLVEYDLDLQPIEEALRLGLLSFQTSVFIQMKNIRVKYEYLMDRLRTAVNRIPEHVPALADLKLWILLMGAIALFDPDQTWLEDSVRRMAKGRSFEEIRELMRTIMWIDLVHDIPGRQVYESAQCDEVDLGLGRDRTQLL